MHEIFIEYQIGLKSHTKKIPIENQTPIEKQFAISLPLITGAKIIFPLKKEIKIVVGKEINLQKIALEKYKIEKYDLNLEDLAKLALKGYTRACLLNYKKYDQIVVGIEKEDYIVSDYFALKRFIDKISNRSTVSM